MNISKIAGSALKVPILLATLSGCNDPIPPDVKKVRDITNQVTNEVKKSCPTALPTQPGKVRRWIGSTTQEQFYISRINEKCVKEVTHGQSKDNCTVSLSAHTPLSLSIVVTCQNNLSSYSGEQQEY